VSPVKYELGFYIPEDTILHSHRRENLKSNRNNKIFLIKRLDIILCPTSCKLKIIIALQVATKTDAMAY
jgi:hypothetical protein